MYIVILSNIGTCIVKMHWWRQNYKFVEAITYYLFQTPCYLVFWGISSSLLFGYYYYLLDFVLFFASVYSYDRLAIIRKTHKYRGDGSEKNIIGVPILNSFFHFPKLGLGERPCLVGEGKKELM